MAAPVLQHSYALADSNQITTNIGNVTVDAGTVDPMIVVMHHGPVNANMTGSSWNGQAFTMIPGLVANNFWTAAAYLIPSSTGAFTLSSTFPFFGDILVLQVAVLSGAKAIGSGVTNDGGTATSASTVLTTTADNSMVIDFAMSSVNSAHTQGAGQTLIQTTPQSTYRMSTSYQTVPAKGTATTMSVSAASSNWEINAIEICSEIPTSPSQFFMVF